MTRRRGLALLCGLLCGGLPGWLVAQEDPVRIEVASMAADWMRVIGLDVKVEAVEASELVVRVFDSRQFDMTILGWRLARVPSRLVIECVMPIWWHPCGGLAMGQAAILRLFPLHGCKRAVLPTCQQTRPAWDRLRAAPSAWRFVRES